MSRGDIVGCGWLVVASLIVGGAAGLSAPAAHADSVTDMAFLRVIDAEGIGYTSASNVIAAAHEVCAHRDDGHAQVETVTWVFQLTDLDRDHAAFFVGAAEAAYCPHHLSIGAPVRDRWLV
jgi:hypothetical protein